MAAFLHPLSQLTPEEIKHSARLVREKYSQDVEIVFKTITLDKPDKALVKEYLAAEHTHSSSRPVLERRSFVAYYKKNEDVLYEAFLHLTRDTAATVVEQERALHGPADFEEWAAVEALVYKDATVQAEIKKLNLVDESLVVCEPWSYGSDGIDDERRLCQCFMFLRNPDDPGDLDSNHYARPLPFSPVVDVVTMKVIRIDWLPLGKDNAVRETGTFRVPPSNDYTPERQQLRTDLKPLHVVQPDGASFTITQDFAETNLIEWQKWRLRLGFNGREGMVLHDIHYDGRPLFYRLALSDMNIPYADPRHPYHKKSAFDLGDAGAGYTANNLKLGCDCLGSIHYVSAPLSGPGGDPIQMENCVCIHEQDSGIGWKHTNYRTGRAVVTRRRELVMQSILTAGEITYEVRATGILSTQPIDEGVEVAWGTVVHPGVLAAHHQHIFCLRADPMIDGPSKTVSFDEAEPLAVSEEFNPHGTGYVSRETIVEKSGGYNLDMAKNRVFKIKNTSSINPVNKKPVAYKIMAPDFQKILAAQDSFNYKRAGFSSHNLFVTKYRPDELYAAGKYTSQSRGGNGVRTWASREDTVVDEDVVVWVQFGMNHIPRIEDFPVMPCEIMQVHFKPVNFFTKNPALDVPPATQSVSKSCLLSVESKIEHM